MKICRAKTCIRPIYLYLCNMKQEEAMALWHMATKDTLKK